MTPSPTGLKCARYIVPVQKGPNYYLYHAYPEGAKICCIYIVPVPKWPKYAIYMVPVKKGLKI